MKMASKRERVLWPPAYSGFLKEGKVSIMELSGTDTVWVLLSTALVMLMTPGLALFYAGLTERRSAINTLLMSFASIGVVSLVWVVIGYSVAFSEGNAWLGGLDYVFLNGVDLTPLEGATIPHLLFAAFQMMFAVITPALISGAVVGRMKFSAYLWFCVLWSLCVYAPLCHWVWGGGFLSQDGALDFAGGTVVHVSAGVSALVAAWVLGPRVGAEKHSNGAYNIPMVLLGAGLLWFGWFGFNAGSSLAADTIAVNALTTTHLAAAMAMVTWLALEAFCGKRPSATGLAIGAVVGLVGITPAAGYVEINGALAIGGLSSAAAFGVLHVLEKRSLDDTLDVFACHGIGGIVGSILTGVFATTAVNPAGADGLLAGNPGQLLPQITSVLAAAVLALVGTWGILKVLELTIGIRVSSVEERSLDRALHAESVYLAPSEKLFGERVVDAGFATERQIMEALHIQRNQLPSTPLGEILRSRGVLKLDELEVLLSS